MIPAPAEAEKSIKNAAVAELSPIIIPADI